MLILRRLLSFALLCSVAFVPGSDRPLTAQALPTLFEAGQPGAKPKGRAVRPHKARKAKLKLEALNAPAFRLNLFDDADRVVTRRNAKQVGPNRYTWEGLTDDGGLVTFAVVNGVTTGTVFLDDRSFEITPDEDGEYTIEELNAAAFPTEDAPLDAPEAEDEALDMAADVAGSGTTSTAAVAADGATEITVMVLWTPAARSAAGGVSNIESLILSAVNNANLAYTNSLVNAQLKLVYSGEVAFTETSNPSSDLAALKSTIDGKMDGIHALRNQYAADIVSLIGNGYASGGTCGMGYLMSSPSASFAVNAFNIVDRTCASGYLSFAHEVGHNQGLQHDPGNAGGSPSYSYAYGYQDPGGSFRTVLSYGSATRVPNFSSPLVSRSGKVTGTATQDNAKALNNTAAIVASFRGAPSTPTCSYSVSPTALSFQSASGSATVTVTTQAGCSWSSSGASWATVSGSGTGSGTATVSVTSNGSASRSATLTIAGKSVSVSQAAATTCSYVVSPTALSFQSASGSATVTVTTQAGCAWSSSSGSSWAAVSGSGTGSGTATVSVTSNGSASRSATLTIAGKSVSVSQAAATTTCSYAVSPTTLSLAGPANSATVTVTTQAGCTWSSTSPTSWATVTGSGTGSGTATVAVTANNGVRRTATLSIAGQSVKVIQACSFSLSKTSLVFTAAGGTQTVAVDTAAGCTWSSGGTNAWVTVAGSAVGPGTVTVTTKQRTDTTSLSKEIKAAGIPISVTQAGIQ